MTILIMTSYLILFILVALISVTLPKCLPFINFTTNEPNPIQGERLSDFKIRKLVFMLNWTLIIFASFSFVYLLHTFIKTNYIHHILLAISFLLLFVSCVAIFANIAFIFSWIKTRFFGRNPKCDFQDITSFHGG